jgi:indole-3-glycerol phosphate synthase
MEYIATPTPRARSEMDITSVFGTVVGGSNPSGRTMKKPMIIAEVKTQSPFGFVSDKSWDQLFAIANEIGDMISIHTDPRWGGSFDLIKKARALTQKPILAKGLHEKDADVERAIDCGADFVLVVGRIPGVFSEKCMVEFHSLAQLKLVPTKQKTVWNSRDLSTGGMKTETFDEARAIFSGWLCQASNIRNVADIKPGADAVLVGAHLLEFAESLKNQKN